MLHQLLTPRLDALVTATQVIAASLDAAALAAQATADDAAAAAAAAQVTADAAGAAAAAAQADADAAAAAAAAAQVTADAALVAAGLAATAINVRSVADLPAPVGTVYTLAEGRYNFVGDVAIPNGYQIAVAAAGAFILCDAPGSATITGSHPTALIVMTGGGLANVVVVNTYGGDGADVQHFGGLRIDSVQLKGSGTQLRLSGTSAIVVLRNPTIEPSSAASGTRSIVVDAAAVYQAIGMPAGLGWSNLWALSNITAMEVEAGAIVVDWQFSSGTLYNHPSQPANCIGINNLGTIGKFLFSGTPMLYFGGAGSTELVGIDPTRSIITGVSSGTSSLTSTAINSSVFGALELDSPGGVVMALTGGVTWDALVVTGDTLSSTSSLLSRAATGQLATTWVVSTTNGVAEFLITLVKAGGAVTINLRFELSTDNGGTWAPIGIPFSGEVSTVAKQFAGRVNVRMSAGHRIRVTARAPGGAVTVSTTTYRLAIESAR